MAAGGRTNIGSDGEKARPVPLHHGSTFDVPSYFVLALPMRAQELEISLTEDVRMGIDQAHREFSIGLMARVLPRSRCGSARRMTSQELPDLLARQRHVDVRDSERGEARGRHSR
jgi:hypothetical protein